MLKLEKEMYKNLNRIEKFYLQIQLNQGNSLKIQISGIRDRFQIILHIDFPFFQETNSLSKCTESYLIKDTTGHIMSQVILLNSLKASLQEFLKKFTGKKGIHPKQALYPILHAIKRLMPQLEKLIFKNQKRKSVKPLNLSNHIIQFKDEKLLD
ncbi:unnamed protein product [Paramecium octaurelia]|uniref:Uncharacterized protein n=1 Tax=Paramecium octaurelia TaxID=43137 RepID=A0A8S1UGC8_PAROT|nr:unnamed protein product [Paramecium octaurelia]